MRSKRVESLDARVGGLQAEAAAKLDTVLRAAIDKQRGEKTHTPKSGLIRWQSADCLRLLTSDTLVSY